MVDKPLSLWYILTLVLNPTHTTFLSVKREDCLPVGRRKGYLSWHIVIHCVI